MFYFTCNHGLTQQFPATRNVLYFAKRDVAFRTSCVTVEIGLKILVTYGHRLRTLPNNKLDALGHDLFVYIEVVTCGYYLYRLSVTGGGVAESKNLGA